MYTEINQRRRHNGPLRTSANDALQVAHSLDNLTQQRLATLNNGNVDQFVNHHRPSCRTPPPVYNSLPATPPPSYTPRTIEPDFSTVSAPTPTVATANLDDEPQQEAVVVLPLLDRQANGIGECYAEVGVRANNDSDIVVERRVQLESHRLENVTNVRNVRHTAPSVERRTVQETSSLSQPQYQQQHRRRQCLRSLHCQRLSNININAASTDSFTTSSSSSSGSETEINTVASGLRRRRVRLRRANGLKDAYCPDLLHACSLILRQQQQPQQQQTSRPAFGFNSDYAEIDEIRQHQFRQHDHLHLNSSVHSTPELREQFSSHNAGVSYSRQIYAISTAQVNADLERVDNQVNQRLESQEMGQNLSLRRPRISLTWVLREQQQQQQYEQEEKQDQENKQTEEPKKPEEQDTTIASTTTVEKQNNNNGYANGVNGAVDHVTNQKRSNAILQPNQLETTTTTTTTKKRYRIKQIHGSNDPLNGYATTPTTQTGALVPQKFFSNQNLLDCKTCDKARRQTPSKELLFVCTPQRLPKSYISDTSEIQLALAKKRNEIRKKLAAKMASLQAGHRIGDGAEVPQSAAANVVSTPNGISENDELKTLKGTYSEPSLIAASESVVPHRRHRHRKRRDRNRVQKFGYEISNVDEFLSKCSLASPGNIPMVLSNASTLYQTRPGGYQIEIPLPLGMVVNAVFKNQNWVYVQTPHAEEGYVGYSCCLPLGILPPSARDNGSSKKPTPCWESNCDIFPRPCGNMTDSEKEIRLRSGTRSDGARTPRGKRTDSQTHNDLVDTVNGNISMVYGEHHVDKLYLRAASQPKLVEKAYAQLRLTKMSPSIRSSNDEYVILQQQKSKLHVQRHMQQQQQQLQHFHNQQHQQQLQLNGPYITNGHNGQHLHPKNITSLQTNQTNTTDANNMNSNNVKTTTPSLASHQHINANLHHHSSLLTVVSRKHHHSGMRQTLVAINTDYKTDSITLHKGEIVTLCECRETKDHRQWFYVKTRDGREGYIPAEVAGHGYL